VVPRVPSAAARIAVADRGLINPGPHRWSIWPRSHTITTSDGLYSAATWPFRSIPLQASPRLKSEIKYFGRSLNHPVDQND